MFWVLKLTVCSHNTIKSYLKRSRTVTVLVIWVSLNNRCGVSMHWVMEKYDLCVSIRHGYIFVGLYTPCAFSPADWITDFVLKSSLQLYTEAPSSFNVTVVIMLHSQWDSTNKLASLLTVNYTLNTNSLRHNNTLDFYWRIFSGCFQILKAQVNYTQYSWQYWVQMQDALNIGFIFNLH